MPRTPETLWLRLLGRETVQKQAIDELEALSLDDPLRSATLHLFYNLRRNLAARENLESSDRELIMRLAPLYQQDREQAVQEALQQQARAMIENLLTVRFGSMDEELAVIIEPIMALEPQELIPLLMQLSREELLARFGSDD